MVSMGHRLRDFYNRIVDHLAYAISDWLGSRAAFVQITLGTILWVPFVIIGLDGHGFLYLYVATALSLITQVPLAMIGLRASKRAQAAEDKGTQLQESMLAMLNGMHALLQGVRAELSQQDEVLDEIHQAHLEHKELVEDIKDSLSDT